MRFGAFLVFAGALVGPRVRRHGALGLRRRLADAAGHPRLRRRRAGGDGLRLLGTGGRAGRRRAQGLRAPGAAAPQRGVRAGSAPACCGSAGSASTAAAASPPATPACSRSSTRCSARRARCWRLVRPRPDPRAQGHRHRRRHRDHRRVRRHHAGGRLRQPRAGRWCSARWRRCPSYAVIVWRTRTRVDETLDVLAAHGIAGFIGILFIGFFAAGVVERRVRRPLLRQRRPAPGPGGRRRWPRPPTRSSRPTCCCA